MPGGRGGGEGVVLNFNFPLRKLARVLRPETRRSALGRGEATMNKIWVAVMALALVAASSGRMLAATPDDKAQEIYDTKGQTLVDLQDLQKKFTQLAGAVPAEKYGWRPAEGVRSIGEVYLHVAQANYGFAKFLGATPPVDFDTKNFEKSTTDKAKIDEQLNASFEYVRGVIGKLSNAD